MKKMFSFLGIFLVVMGMFLLAIGYASPSGTGQDFIDDLIDDSSHFGGNYPPSWPSGESGNGDSEPPSSGGGEDLLPYVTLPFIGIQLNNLELMGFALIIMGLLVFWISGGKL